MNIYLMRHGDAVYQGSDDLSPLSGQGKQDIDAIAKFILPWRLHARVFHSEKLRAKQTAERLSAGFIVESITERAGLSPSDSIIAMVDELNEMNSDTLLVGHMPFMGRLVSQLLYQNAGQDVMNFHKGTLVCLQLISYRQWAIDWVIHPELVSLKTTKSTI